ncbi:MAG: tail fiber assembly protein [Plesiomonas sp.]
MLFSRETCGFFDELLIHDYNMIDTLPSDIIEMTNDEISEFYMTNPPEGKRLGSSEYGRPCWVDIPPPSPEEQVAHAEAVKSTLQREAEDAIKPLERAKSLGIATPQELALLTEWEKYSVYLMRVDTSTAPNITWPVKPVAV